MVRSAEVGALPNRWAPGEHNGTFRGHDLAFVGANAALEQDRRDDAFASALQRKAAFIDERPSRIIASYDGVHEDRLT